MASKTKPKAKKAGGKDENETVEPPADENEKADPQTLMEKAYQRVGEKLEDTAQSSKAIDDLVKLMKLEKDLGGGENEVKEVKVRWEPSEDESSSEG